MIALKSLFTLFALPLALGRVFNMTAPDTVTAGQNITAVLHTEGYIQNWDDFGVIWGLRQPSLDCEQCVGDRIAYDNLFERPGYNDNHGNATFQVPITEYTTPGDYVLVASVPYLVGASGGTHFNVFTQNITVNAPSA